MLTKKNKRMVRKMKKYIKTFPLTEKEIDQMIEDITGMAEEAQERNENFETVLGKSQTLTVPSTSTTLPDVPYASLKPAKA